MRIAIVGGGCSGLLVAFHLLRNCHQQQSVTIIEPRADLGRGLAYSTTFDDHLLNVSAEKMSALSSEPSHFLDWLHARGYPCDSRSIFAPRRLFGEYLGNLLHNVGRPRHIRAEVVAIHAAGNGATLVLSDGSELEADKIVLALGNPVSGAPLGTVFGSIGDQWQSSPWVGDALRLRAPDERILLIGAGQTAVDAAIALESQSNRCHITMLSRSGNLPQVHPASAVTFPTPPIAEYETITQIVRELRAQVRTARESGIGWQAVIDALRPISNAVWHRLPVAERRRFHRHLKTYWETHRSRMPPFVHERLQQLRTNGSLEVIAGRLIECAGRDGEVAVHVALRNGGERQIRIDRAINCTGIHEYYNVRPRPIIAALLEQGLATPNDLGIGFRTDEHGALAGPARNILFTLGPPRRGGLFETIAVPEIRVQAETLAAHLLGSYQCRTDW
jgi:uncharacterized NAD(P)/FAD-binding protein YdhS